MDTGCVVCYLDYTENNDLIVCWNNHKLCKICYDTLITGPRTNDKKCPSCRVLMFDWRGGNPVAQDGVDVNDRSQVFAYPHQLPPLIAVDSIPTQHVLKAQRLHVDPFDMVTLDHCKNGDLDYTRRTGLNNINTYLVTLCDEAHQQGDPAWVYHTNHYKIEPRYAHASPHIYVLKCNDKVVGVCKNYLNDLRQSRQHRIEFTTPKKRCGQCRRFGHTRRSCQQGAGD